MSDQISKKALELTAERKQEFAAAVKNVDLPPLPSVAARLIAEINAPDPDMDRVARAIATSPETTAKVIQTVNSSIFSLRNPVLSMRHAIALLGLRHIRPIALSFAMMDALPRPTGGLFDQQGFWTDALIRAMFARGFTARTNHGEEENAFTAALLFDLAIPVLLIVWPR